MKEQGKPKVGGVIGIDEVGRGPLAGPVTVSAVYLMYPYRTKQQIFSNIVRDSKRIQKALRNNIYKTLRKNRKINIETKYAVVSRSAAFIDKYGIQKATQICVDSCIEILKKQGVSITECMIRTDAGIKVSTYSNQKAYIKGDERFTEIALASIMAKETRDAYMRELAKRHSCFGWESNVGYGTDVHRKAIKKFGVTKYHRISYLKAF